MAENLPVDNIETRTLDQFEIEHVQMLVDGQQSAIGITFSVGYLNAQSEFVAVDRHQIAIDDPQAVIAFATQAVDGGFNLWQNMRAAFRAEVIKALSEL